MRSTKKYLELMMHPSGSTSEVDFFQAKPYLLHQKTIIRTKKWQTLSRKTESPLILLKAH